MSDPRYHYRDPNVITELRATTYPYGGGEPEHGIQITLERDEPSYDCRKQTLRLPRPKAIALAEWILSTYGGSGE